MTRTLFLTLISFSFIWGLMIFNLPSVEAVKFVHMNAETAPTAEEVIDADYIDARLLGNAQTEFVEEFDHRNEDQYSDDVVLDNAAIQYTDILD